MMISLLTRSSNISPFLKGSVKGLLPGVVGVTEKVENVLPSVRQAHTDIKVPDFGHYRRDECKDATKPAKEGLDKRRTLPTALAITGGVAAVYATKCLATGLIGSMSAAKNVLAAGKTEIDLAKIPEGTSKTFKWRGKPIFIRHRTSEEITREQGVDLATLRDPQHDNDRTTKPEWLIVLGICTHLGCVPIANAGDFGGYYCPCHGSHYDASGRIRKGPAPLNLEIPEHTFAEGDLLIVG